MRDLIINRIYDIRDAENKFSKSITRWKNVYIGKDEFKVHLSEVKFNNLTNEELFKIFEVILYYYYKQM